MRPHSGVTGAAPPHTSGGKVIQRIITPPVANCEVCGVKAMCLDWNYNFRYRVMCDNNHVATKECGSAHRAICRWNNAQKRLVNVRALHIAEEIE